MIGAAVTVLLELRDVEARYGPIRALHGVSLRVEEGQAVSLLGANGAGKTTTLRAISGTVRRTGEITFAGRRIGRRGPESIARLGIAHVPEGRGIYGELTVWENALLGGSTRRDRRAVKRDAERALAHFPRIADRRRQQAGTLSGGEQQMLSLARALVSRPRLLMLDEPSLGLAPTAVQEFYRVVRLLNREDGLTVLVVEQNARIALASTAHAYVLEVGRVAMDGPSDELSRDEGVRASYLGY
jgi:branched-chain amino acid transport system ATP-binding protein